MAEEYHRFVLLNTMTSFSTTRARGHDAPTLGALESLKILEARRKKKWAVEFFGSDEKSLHKKDDTRTEEEIEAARLKLGEGHDCIRLRMAKFDEGENFTYVTLLIEAIDASAKNFPVVHTETYEGRKISGDAKERGSTTNHIVVRIPNDGKHDVGKYRCAIEVVHPITRTEIETLLCKQLRRYADAQGLEFSVQVHKKKKPEQKHYRYTPRLHLNADVGRKLNVGADDKVLSHMIFTKRAEKQIIGKGTAIAQEEFLADVEFKIGASQGPVDPEQRRTWTQKVADWYRNLDYEVKLYYRHVNGRIEGGEMHKAIAGAADLLMCPREQILLTKAPESWVSSTNQEIVTALTALLDRDELWEHSKSSN